MSKDNKNTNGKKAKDKLPAKSQKVKADTSQDYLFSMSLPPRIDASTHWLQMLVAAFFTAVIIMITRMATYQRPMAQFFWSNGEDQMTDFFSYYKMTAILICATLVLLFLLYRIFSQSFYIKRSYAYIPMIIYSAFVLLSYVFSDYKEFALLGWNDRFEGTLTLLAYMVMLFFIINSVNSEKNVKWIIYPLAATSTLLGLLGISQALDQDFFQTSFGKKIITPSWFWDQLDSLNFIFDEREIYQTVYNINYVSFYLTLLIPLFGLLFIRSVMLKQEEPMWKKILWGALFTLLIFNLIGSSSSGGLMGMAVAVLIAVIVLNKRILTWWKPVAMLLAITVIVSGLSYSLWVPELTEAISSVLGNETKQEATEEKSGSSANVLGIDYMETSGNKLNVSIGENVITFSTEYTDPFAVRVQDTDEKTLNLIETEAGYRVDDDRFHQLMIRISQDDNENYYLILNTGDKEWPFGITKDGLKYYTGFGRLVNLHQVPAVGWTDNQSFGSGRGYIWSRTIPMMKETMILGRGADTYCAFYPHEDYVGKYNSGEFTKNINIVVDKPHNMYFGAIVGTGGISLIALLVLWVMYIMQSIRIYRKDCYYSFLAYAGVGIFIGIFGFLFAGLVNDSSVSVMPMFYGLLGTGISVNMILTRNTKVASNER